ncbi:MAG TPA: type I-U CRISPR-associated protein Csx17, partial [Nannocystis exedens]|nr:type I-U CRISPR-associated protein Csx17 [Nannocystis exedens]
MNALHIHDLCGCAPTPLAHYLKALAILRLLSEQVDAQARGFWDSEHFCVVTRLDRQELVDFFLHQYIPSPLLDPWNNGSGFYANDNKVALLAIAASQAPRFADYRLAIRAASLVTREFSRAPSGEAKALFIRRWRERWRGISASWIDTVLVIGADGSPTYPALLGTGGNDGRLDFINNYMRQLTRIWDMASPKAHLRPQASLLLYNALFGRITRGLVKGAIGQFMPGNAGGANQGAGFEAKPQVNPWDFVLMLEGTIALRASLVRRAESQGLAQAAAPFAIRGSAAGYGSAAKADESNRGEQWMPLWSTPTTYAEIQQLFAEGRSKIGERTAQRPLEFARAIARLGVARGIDAFERFGFIERNGQANLAVPLGRWRVRPQPHQDLLDDVANWVEKLRQAGRDKQAPGRLQSAARACEEAIQSCCRQYSALHWRALLIRLAKAEQTILHSPRFSTEHDLRPLPRLSSGWLQAIGLRDPEDPDTRELRLA